MGMPVFQQQCPWYNAQISIPNHTLAIKRELIEDIQI